MQNYYDLLGVSRDAPIKEINAALRTLVRRYNEESAKGQIDSGEALKFVNVARYTFADPKRRAHYDGELLEFEAKQREQEQVVAEDENIVDAQEEETNEVAELDPMVEIESLPPENINKVDRNFKASSPNPVHLTTRPANFPTAEDSSDFLDVNSVLTPITLNPQSDQLHFTSALGVDFENDEGLESLLGNNKSEKRSTAPNPPLRFAARFIDYGLWGILLWLGLKGLETFGFLSAETFALLIHPLLAPIIIVISWMLIESIIMIYFPKTPGKYLLNIHVAATVNNPYADKDPNALIAAAFLRASLICWRGIGLGIFPVYLFTLLKSRKNLMKSKESSWDFESDSLVTHGHVSLINRVIVLGLLVAITWAYTAQWTIPAWNMAKITEKSLNKGFSIAQDGYNVIHGMQNYGKELPPTPAKENRTVELEKTAQNLIDKQDWPKLAKHCQSWAKENSQSAIAWYCYGQALAEMKEDKGAIIALKRATNLAPQNDNVRRLLRDVSKREMLERQLRNRGNQSE